MVLKIILRNKNNKYLLRTTRKKYLNICLIQYSPDSPVLWVNMYCNFRAFAVCGSGTFGKKKDSYACT